MMPSHPSAPARCHKILTPKPYVPTQDLSQDPTQLSTHQQDLCPSSQSFVLAIEAQHTQNRQWLPIELRFILVATPADLILL